MGRIRRCVGLGNNLFSRLQCFRDEAGVEFSNLGRLGDEALKGLLGEIGLDFNRLLDALRAEQLLKGGRRCFKVFFRETRRLLGDLPLVIADEVAVNASTWDLPYFCMTSILLNIFLSLL